jgi:hypothetical protein
LANRTNHVPRGSRQIVQAQTQIIRQKMREHKHDYEIIRELQIPEQTFYQYKKRIQKQDAKLWDKVIIDSAKFRALELIQLLEFTKNECVEIAKDPNTKPDDRIEALTTACVAQANIFKMINDGPTFRITLPLFKDKNKNTLELNCNNNNNNSKQLPN